VATDDTTKAAGRGGLAIAVAKVSFILFGFVQQLVLPRVVGVDGYGEISRVLAIVGIVNNVVVSSSIQGVSHAVSGVPEGRAGEALRRALRIHAPIALVLSAGFIALAGPIAGFVGAPHVATPLRYAGLVVLFYGLYAPLVGSLNGRRRFLDQAGLDILYGVLRTTGLLGGAVVLARVVSGPTNGATLGFAAAAAIIVPIAVTRAGLGKSGDAGPSAKTYLAYLGPLALGQVFLSLLLQTDFMLLSRFVGEAAGADTVASDKLMGVYRGVQLFAFLPYQMMMSVTFILFPMLARASAERDHDAVKAYTREGVRLSFVLTGLMCAVVSGLAPHVLRFAFPDEIASRGGDALRVLSLGMGSLSLMGILATALTSIGRPTTAMLLTATAVALIAAGCSLTVPGAGFGEPMLMASAIATSAALTVAAIAGAVLVRRATGGFAPAVTIVRVAAAVAIVVAIGTRAPWLGKLFVPLEAAALGALFIGLLVVTGELGKADLARVMRVAGRGGKAA
jgi:stage V sporulation protein B